MIINTNINSLVASEKVSNTSIAMNKSISRLSSGLQIERASDDASGLSIATKLKAQVSSLSQSLQNINAGVSLTQIADKGFDQQSKLLDTIKQKLIHASSEQVSQEGLVAVAKTVGSLLTQVNNIASQTNYNGINLLDLKTQRTVTITNSNTVTTQNPTTYTVDNTVKDDKTKAEARNAAYYDALTGSTGTIHYTSNTNQYGYRTTQSTNYYDTSSKEVDPTKATDTINIQYVNKLGNGTIIVIDDDRIRRSAQDAFNAQNGTLFSTDDPSYTSTTSTSSYNTPYPMIFQIGEYANNDVTIDAEIESTTGGLGLSSLILDVYDQNDFTHDDANGHLKDIDDAITSLNSWRADYAAAQVQMQSSARSITTSYTNMNIAHSNIRDLDYGKEMVEFTKLDFAFSAGAFAMDKINLLQKDMMNSIIK